MLQKSKHLPKISALSLLSLGLILVIAVAMTSIEDTNLEEKRETLEQAIMRSAVHCYSLEGAYPTEVSYLEEHYDLLIDRDVYIVHYEAFASNIAPDITVIVKE